MASGDATVAAPTVWAMRTDKVFIAFEVISQFFFQILFLNFLDRGRRKCTGLFRGAEDHVQLSTRRDSAGWKEVDK